MATYENGMHYAGSYPASSGSNGYSLTLSVDKIYQWISEKIPKYSIIDAFTINCNAYNNASALTNWAKADMYMCLMDSSDTELVTLYSAMETIDNSSKPHTYSSTQYIHSNNASAGMFNVPNVSCLKFRAQGDVSRVFTFENIKLLWKWTEPTYTISATATAGGTVSGDIGTYDVMTTDQVKTLTAHPNAGYRFVAWQDGSGTVISDNATLQIIVSQYNISAHSTTETYTALFEAADNDLNYDNLFSLASWKDSISSTPVGTGSVSVDITNGTVTLSNCLGDFYTEFGGRAGHYTIPVVAGQEYRFDFKAQHTGDLRIFVFYYNSSGQFIYVSQYEFFKTNERSVVGFNFTPPLTSYDGTSSKCEYIDIRFGTYSEGFYANATISDIAIYKTSWNTHEITNRQYRKVFTIGHELGLLYEPERPGYVFQGWYTGENGTGQHIRKIDSSGSREILRGNTTVYSHWKKRDYYDVNYDNIFSFTDWAYSPSGDVNGLGDSGGAGTITTNFGNGTITVHRTSGSGNFYTMYGAFSPYHHIPVVEGHTYRFEYSVNHTNNVQAYVFFCNDTQNFMLYPPTGYEFDYKFDGTPITFTVPIGCTNICFRLGVSSDTPAVFSNIGLYMVNNEKEITNRPARKNIPYGSSVGTLSVPSREGYSFKGWYVSEDGVDIEIKPSDLFTNSITAYSTWSLNRIYVNTVPVKKIYFGTTPVKEIYMDKVKVYG